ncbi:hypothetical protein HAX54_032604 [Datura stramonium]|uniref:Uncharacterized protein n=1 Tax=Datura stramonium TaxID=4076 RepID=A0ABS8SCU2_DATST|nr:hypothetical protein [Datura stramonium]
MVVVPSSCFSSLVLLALFDPWLEETTHFPLLGFGAIYGALAAWPGLRVAALIVLSVLRVAPGLVAPSPVSRARPFAAWPVRCSMHCSAVSRPVINVHAQKLWIMP